MGIGNFPIKGGTINQPINDGGPAFPVAGFQFKNKDGSEGFILPMEGMSLRDYFAAAALQGIISDASISASIKKDGELVSRSAYEFADAMLKAREAK
jgi:hypothetical protein